MLSWHGRECFCQKPVASSSWRKDYMVPVVKRLAARVASHRGDAEHLSSVPDQPVLTVQTVQTR